MTVPSRGTVELRMDILERLTDRALSEFALLVMHNSATALAGVVRKVELARGKLADLTFESKGFYGPSEAHGFEVVRRRDSVGARPSLLYLHGGGFQQMSRHTHWWIAAKLARAGFCVFNCDYRLAPRHPYPSAPDDARRAYRYVMDHAHEFGGDSRRIVVAGDSAGANLALGLACDASLSLAPAGVALFSGFLQVSGANRLWDGLELPRIVRARIRSIPRDYARIEPDVLPRVPDLTLDPLLWLQAHPEALVELPPIYASCGTADPVLGDTLRLRALLSGFGERHRFELFEGEPHVFQGMPWRKNAHVSLSACARHLGQVREGSATFVEKSSRS